MPTPTAYRRKLIEVALPLEDINKESAREKSIRHGHPSTLHLWWARRPLAACRAVLFGQMVDDPSSLPDEFPTEEAQEAERERLFNIIRDLVKWDNMTDEAVLHKARVEIARSAARNHGVALWPGMQAASIPANDVAAALKQFAPPVLDPFAGGGSIPLEAQRLGLEAHASDLNPVAVLINKALIEIPPKFAGQPPVNPESRKMYLQKEWKAAEGLAEDVRYYGKWMRDQAFKRIGDLYPKVQLPKEQGGGEATAIAWLWARTVTCPNPACGARMPLVRSFALSTKKGKEAWALPIVDRSMTPPTISFAVQHGAGAPEGTVNRTGARCIVCGTSVPFDHVRTEGKAGRMSAQMMAIVAEGKGARVYQPPSAEQIAIAAQEQPHDVPDSDLPERALSFRVQVYGMTKHRDLFTYRQLVALATFSNLVGQARKKVLVDSDDNVAYADAVATYLALAVDKTIDRNTSLCTWETGMDRMRNTFGRQALPMVWDYAETNPFAGAGGDIAGSAKSLCEVLDALNFTRHGTAEQLDATAAINGITHPLISTDPPYYDNIGYADLSDFFYVWLRRSLGNVYPELFGTLLVPKAAELVATPYRFGGSTEKARLFFEEGLGRAFARMREAETPAFPLAIYYAFKQSENEADEDGNGNAASASTGWETMLAGLLQAGFSIHGTWPIRTELATRSVGTGTNALASSIVLVCRARPADAPVATRRDFLNTLKRELPGALRDLQRGNIAPVDLAQAAIGPGMAVFSHYSKVLESDDKPMRVRTALQLINQTLDEVLAEQEGEFDSDTRFAVTWFEQYGMGQGAFGEADVLARAKDTSVSGLDEGDVLVARGGKVRLLRRDELSEKWHPQQDHRLSVWKVTQRLIQALMDGGGAQAAAQLLDAVGSDYGEKARDLAYRLYTTSERRKWTQEAFAYNTLVTEWRDITGGVEAVRQQAQAVVRQAILIDSSGSAQ